MKSNDTVIVIQKQAQQIILLCLWRLSKNYEKELEDRVAGEE